MAYEVIETYLTDIMGPQLLALGIPHAIIENVSVSVREQMASCVYHWNDVAFRKALLATGEEEGAFYLPKAAIDVRNFVVVTIRNSALESIHADSYIPSEQGRRLRPEDIKAITSAAIEYFKRIDFPKTAEEINAPDRDRYGKLALRYPASWAALTNLVGALDQVVEYDPIPFAKKPDLNNLRPRQAVNGLFFEESRSQLMQITDDGFALTIDHGLMHILNTVVENRMPFIGDSFKGISRNIEKLLAIMEYILGNDLWIITTNYLIDNGHVERRKKLLRPGHDLEEIKRNFLNGTGITTHHRSWLKSAAQV
jgi:hypothetical protein